MTYNQGNVNGLWRLKAVGSDQTAINTPTPAPEAAVAETDACCVYGANGEFERPKMTMNGAPFAGKPLS